jgi:hypothetical protein
MSDEKSNLVAKIQHFYEIMICANQSLIDKAFVQDIQSEKKILCENASCLNTLINDYEKTFDSILYKDS